MSEPKQPYKAGNEPPNLREARCCEGCKLSAYLSLNTFMECRKYHCKVKYRNVCDDYEPEEWYQFREHNPTIYGNFSQNVTKIQLVTI